LQPSLAAYPGGRNSLVLLEINMKYRNEPINVQIVKLDMPLVEVGGKRFDTLREDFYDNAVNLVNNARQPTPIFSPYDIALSGGEPFSVWS
jgi:hypothetical protein